MLHTCYRAHAGLRIPPADHTRPCSAARHPSCGPPASTPSGKPGLPNARPSAPDLGVAHGHHLPWRLPRSPKRSEEHTSELQSLMRISYAVFCLKKKKTNTQTHKNSKSEKSQHN